MKILSQDIKICTKCGQEKHISEFHKDRHKKDGLYPSCKECHTVQSKLYGKLNQVKIRKANLKRQYGLSSEEYQELLIQQNGVCAICGELKISSKQLAVDHNHSTGEIRGLLCSRCNPGIGYFMEDCILLKKAIMYLEKYNG